MAIKYVPYFPNTVEGQAVLNNFVRTQRLLRYRESDKVAERVIRGMPLYEVTETEKVGENETENMIIHGECVSACAYLKEKGIKIDLVYIDPPFASGADYAKKIYIRRNPLVAKAIQKAEQELDDEALKNFEEKMYGDIWDKEKYLNWMYENLMAIRSVMSETASIYVHLDYHIGHYVKILLDEIFGESNFTNEIIWFYNNKMSGNTSSHAFVCEHDTLFLYSLSEQNIFNVIYEEREKAVKQSKRVKVDGKNMRARDDEGNIIYELSTEKKIKDVWKIPYIASTDSQRTDYATQKPEALLERVIRASSDEGMVVADFFGGSGVTAAVASKLGRKFVHVDVNVNSVQTARDRLKNNGTDFKVMKVQDGVSLFRNPIQTKDALPQIIPGLKVDSSFGSVWIGSITDSSYGASPVYIPDLQDSSSRILDVVTLNRIINDAMPQLSPSIKRVIIYYIDIVDRQEIDDFINENNDTVIEIELRDMKELLDNAVLEDDIDYTVEEDETKMVDIYTVTINKFYSDRVSQKIREFNQRALANSKKKFDPIELSEEGLEAIEMVSLDCVSADKNAPWHSDSEIKIEKNSTVTKNGRKTTEQWDGKIHSDPKPLRMKIRNICGDETIVVI